MFPACASNCFLSWQILYTTQYSGKLSSEDNTWSVSAVFHSERSCVWLNTTCFASVEPFWQNTATCPGSKNWKAKLFSTAPKRIKCLLRILRWATIIFISGTSNPACFWVTWNMNPNASLTDEHNSSSAALKMVSTHFRVDSPCTHSNSKSWSSCVFWCIVNHWITFLKQLQSESPVLVRQVKEKKWMCRL